MAALRYKVQSRLTWDNATMSAQLVFFADRPAEVVLEGKCPRCTHDTSFAWPLLVYRDEALKPETQETAEPAFSITAVQEATAPPSTETYDIRVECRCNRPHNDEKGVPHDCCGAYWYKRVERNGHEVRATRGHRADAPDAEDAAELLQDAETQVALVRKVAENWRTGLAGLLGLIAAVSVVKGRDTISDLDQDVKVVIGFLLLAAVLLAALGLLHALRAAYGWPEEVGTTYRSRWTPLLARAAQAKDDLQVSVAYGVATFLLVITAVGFAWYGSEDPPAFLSVEFVGTDKKPQQVCGEVKPSDEESVANQAEGEKPQTVPLDMTTALRVVSSCG